MPSPQECKQLKEDLSSLSSLGEEFEHLLKIAVQSGKEEDIQILEELKQEMMSKKEGLREKLWPFPELPRQELESQYISQVEILERTGLLVRLSDSRLGLKLNNQEYSLPSFQEITRRLREKREILKNKISQGFNQIQITPLVSIETLKQTLGRLLIEHHKNHKLFKAKRNPTVSSEASGEGRKDKDEPLDLDVSSPVYVYDQFQDTPGLRYYPKAFDPDNHRGITKDQLISETQGFNIILTEKSLFLPQENDPNNLPIPSTGSLQAGSGHRNGRKRIENNKTSIEYLNLINQDSQYKDESYLTIEDWLTQFITHLEQTDQASNDWNDNNAAWLPGNYLPPTLEERRQNPGSSGKLPDGAWRRGAREARVGWGDPVIRRSGWGARPSVRI